MSTDYTDPTGPAKPAGGITEKNMITTETKTAERTITIDAKYFYALMKITGQQIDPATAEVDWTYAQTLDPYGVHPDLPEEAQQVGRSYFARNPGSDIWVSFGDLPEVTLNALRHKRKAAFGIGGANEADDFIPPF